MKYLIGHKIKAARKKSGISQSELAKKIGVTTAYISKLECGYSLPADDLCMNIAGALSLDNRSVRELRFFALEERAGIKIDEIYPYAENSASGHKLDAIETAIFDVLGLLSDWQKREVLNYAAWIKDRPMD